MNVRKVINTIDTHTGGEPTRNVVGGIIHIPGNTMEEKMEYMANEGDWIRRFLCCEPRGNDVMSGTIITEPCHDNADVGVLFFEVGGWMPMCGHDTIGVATALIESGMVDITEPITNITIDTPAGLIKLEVKVHNGRAENVTFINAPAFVLKKDIVINTTDYGNLKLDIAYGGNIYAILPISSIGLKICPENANKIIAAGNSIKSDINNSIEVCHPEIPFENHVTHIEFYEETAQKNIIKNAVVIPPGAIDRSPCGTGTSAKLSVLASKGEIHLGESFIHESIIGSRFTCKYVDNSNVCGIPSVIPSVTGKAWVTGINTFILEPDDIFPEGFTL